MPCPAAAAAAGRPGVRHSAGSLLRSRPTDVRTYEQKRRQPHAGNQKHPLQPVPATTIDREGTSALLKQIINTSTVQNMYMYMYTPLLHARLGRKGPISKARQRHAHHNRIMYKTR
jgi:hypothetical protein